ncbi:MAG: ABC transporter permease [Vicinamibacterales bacterium]
MTAWLDGLRLDIVHGARSLGRAYGSTVASVATLAVGVGASTAIFSVVYALVLRPLPFTPDADQLVRLVASLPSPNDPAAAPRRIVVDLSTDDVAGILARTRSVTAAGVVSGTIVGLQGADEAGRLQCARISASALAVLGARPGLGRLWTASEEAGAPDVVLLSHALWMRAFAGDPSIVGRSIVLETVLGRRTERPYTVVGVMDAAFAFPVAQTQLWLPPPAPAGGARAFRGQLLARLAPGVSPDVAAGEIGPIVRELRQHPSDVRYEVVRERDEISRAVRPAIGMLVALVLVVLLMSSVDVTNLQLARAMTRSREFATRAALGASRSRLVRQCVTEGALVGIAGGSGGVALAYWGVALLRAAARSMARFDLRSAGDLPSLDGVAVDGVVLAAGVGVALAAGILVGLASSVRVSRWSAFGRPGASRAMSGTGGGVWLARRLLVVLQIAAAMVLLVSAVLLSRSLANLVSVDPGYASRDVLSFQVGLPVSRYPDDRQRSFAEALVDRLQAEPDVLSAAYANQLPMVQLRDTGGGVWRSPDATRQPAPDGADGRFVSRDYFDAMGIRLVAGRGFQASDDAWRPRVLVINEALARRQFPGEDPIGALVYLGRDLHPWRVVGIVADVRQFRLDREAEPQFFADLRQWTTGGVPLFPVGAYYVVRARGGVDALVPTVRRIVRGLDEGATLFNVAPMDAIVASTVSSPRLYATLVSVFAAIGVVLAVVGVFGVLAFLVRERTAEIGIRMALGAGRGHVMWGVAAQGLALVAAGIGLGLAGAVTTGRFVASLLFGVSSHDVGTFASATLVLIGVASLAVWLPARRAASVDPIAAIRGE